MSRPAKKDPSAVNPIRVTPREAGTPLEAFLALRLDLSRKRVKALLDRRQVFVNDGCVWMARHPLRAGDRIELAAAPEAKAPSKIPIMFEDDHVLVADKPSNMLTVGENSLETAMRTYYGEPAIAAAHRLDRDTTGCVLLARTEAALEALTAAFRVHAVEKRYHAIAHGRLEPPQQKLTAELDQRRAVTHVKTLDGNRLASHLLIRIDTGRTHQIRKHLAGIRHPIVGDRHYRRGLTPGKAELQVGRQMLHAASIQCRHPVTGRPLRASAPLPRDFHQCLKLYRLS